MRVKWSILMIATLAAIIMVRVGKLTDSSARGSASFVSIPKSLDGYSSHDLELDKVSMELLEPDGYLWRSYEHPDGRYVDFLVVYGRHKKTFHSPGYCMSGGGWSEVDKGVESIPVKLNGKETPCEFNWMRIRKDGEERIALWCFIEKNQTTASLVKMNLYLLYDGLVTRRASGALFRIIMPLTSPSENIDISRDFIRELLPRTIKIVSVAGRPSKASREESR